ncbi:HPr kinase/phosphorylase [Swaminathania salitolerans]|uniref:HPr kinase/phosphorylase C-terminal domain-containing protein n=1 Tax=Swaminathania salitolerans TaxID=182838 RepID=A0A511BQK1_9PROT|nr:HPr kinase/phosphatase C-terminal domain-containing protein [Swaminathania salitolerans]GBQ13564.1 HPr kinase [Swaminathania salitolerans LMG 21291]GEL02352.1 hypothetical protein SSA02_15150 [Swaminathania salitolerans]
MHGAEHTAQSPPCTSLIHASCAAWNGQGVLLTGASGSGKSSLLLRLVDAGFALVADDRVELRGGEACAPPALAGLMEIRGLGIVSMPSLPRCRIRLHVELDSETPPERLPRSALHVASGAWSIRLDAFHADAVSIIRTALHCAEGRYTLVCGVNGGTAFSKPLPFGTEED